MGITVGQIDELRRKLDELPPPDTAKREVSKQEAVALLSDQVMKLQRRGYALDEIAHFLKANGLAVTVQSLKSYLSRARRGTKTRASNATRAPTSAKRATPEVSPAAPSKRAKQQLETHRPENESSNASTNGTRSSSFMPRADSTNI